MDLYFRRHDGSAATCDDFLAAMADANGADLTQFSRWYSQAGTPQASFTPTPRTTSTSRTRRRAIVGACPTRPPWHAAALHAHTLHARSSLAPTLPHG